MANEGSGLHFDETDSLIALPTLGCFTLGYSLIVPKSHRTSFASQSPIELAETEAFAEKVRAISEEVFGPTIIAEHGSGEQGEATAACCDHAHLHIIPTNNFEKVVSIYEKIGGHGAISDSMQSLRRLEGLSYLLLSGKRGKWMTWTGAYRFPRQWIRRAVTTADGGKKQYDWKSYPYRYNMRQTHFLFRYKMKKARIIE